ncbi:SDR family NAD(P)-dependent oxidoreductase [Curvivirga sp.]|uniref:SDR family NAD(P)-dependent oxidoreductase n=1 Tax=Curvivirga sp. TaxID=2856848 RepID=UPI003B5B45E2
MKKLEGKVALVSGSGRGIGREIALKLASEGASIVVNDLDKEPAEETISLIKEIGSNAVASIGDVTDKAFPKKFVDTAINELGGLDIIVNNAGYTWDNVIHKMSDDQFDAVMDVHVGAPFRILREASNFIRDAAKAEIEKDGVARCRKVVNISSISGLYGIAGQVNYSAAKSALVGMTRTLCKEWGRYNVTVNCVAFGLIQTRMTQALNSSEAETVVVGDKELKAGMQPEMIDMITKMTPLGRPGSPEDAANAVYLYCAPESDFISGQVTVAAGGLII